MMRRCFLYFFILAIMLLLPRCTHNPFDDDKISSNMVKISGRVLLGDDKSPEIVHVWLEGFDLTTHPDAQGNFSFLLPSPSLQPYGGLTGSFKIFFFMADYKLDSATVMVKNGQLLTNHGDIDENGHLRYLKILPKKLRIFLSVSPDTAIEDSTNSLLLELRIEATADTVFIHYPDRSPGPLSILFIKNLSDTTQPVKIFEGSPFASAAPMLTDSVSINPLFWYDGVTLADLDLPKGTYQIIPFFVIDHKKVPADLLDNIGRLIDKPTLQFLDVPTYRRGGTFIIVESGNK